MTKKVTHFIIVSLFIILFCSASECCYQGDTVSCSGYPSNSPPSVSCSVYNPYNSTAIRHALKVCTVGYIYQNVDIQLSIFESFIELPLELGDNVTSLEIYYESFYYRYFYYYFTTRPSLSILPVKTHLNVTVFSLQYIDLNLRYNGGLSTIFPNLQKMNFNYVASINANVSFFTGLNSLSYLYWSRGSLVNISDNAFEGLTSLSHIELSYHSISYLPSLAFQNLPSLQYVRVYDNPLNCTCRLQWISIVDSKYGIDFNGNCIDGRGSVDSVSTYSDCHSTESYQCFNKSISCENSCINTPTSYICACEEGFGLTLREAEQACHDIDECVQNASLCQGQKCRNTLGSYQCFCDEGFYAEENSCSDVNECSSIPCEHACTNIIGSFICSCLPGFVLDTDMRTCQCPTGFLLSLDRSRCVDIDECLHNNYSCEHRCVNLVGSYDCVCAEGFGLTVRGKDELCADIDECVQNGNLCPGQKCRNTLGSYECSCEEGFGLTVRGKDETCVDIDECVQNGSLCPGQKCRNTLGSFECSCDECFQFSTSQGSGLSALTTFFIVVSCLETLILLLCSIFLIIAGICYFKKFKLHKTAAASNVAGPTEGEEEYIDSRTLEVVGAKQKKVQLAQYVYLDDEEALKAIKQVSYPASSSSVDSSSRLETSVRQDSSQRIYPNYANLKDFN